MIQDSPSHLQPRQLWNLPSETTHPARAHCTPFVLPSAGVLTLGDGAVVTLTTDVIFQPECTGALVGDVFSVGHLKDPFYASTIPMVYVIASATVIAWVLVIMLTITSRTSFIGAVAAPAFSNGHGIIGGANGGSSGITGTGGSRPWLQKVAALAVAISLTIATADTLEVAGRQYGGGFMDAESLRKEVLGSLEIRITRVISDIFLWLAQVQTLIRLFPRHREKVLIKWIGFVLIIFDTIFSCLNSFLINSVAKSRPADAIPALSYLFELALGLLYAAWVLYYTLTKRRYAFYHPKMRSIALIALLSIVSILTPVVFFITDVSNQDVAGWGDYFRWVGAAAASVVVWEWVERIEALERDDKKDGILGREIFDGDEMLDVLPEDGSAWTQSRNLNRNFRRHHDNNDRGGGNQSTMVESGFNGMAHRFRLRHQDSPQHYPLGRAHSGVGPSRNGNGTSQPTPGRSLPVGQTQPPQVASPINRTDTSSAGSTVYVVRYHPLADVPQPVRRRAPANRSDRAHNTSGPPRRKTNNKPSEKDWAEGEDEPQPNKLRDHSSWLSVPNPFKRKRTSPPQEVQRAREASGQKPATPAQSHSIWDVRSRLGVFAAEASDRFRERSSGRKEESAIPVTVIPAQPRGSNRTWSPAQGVHVVVTQPVAGHKSGDDPSSSGGTTSITLTAETQQQRPNASTTEGTGAGANTNEGRNMTPTVTFSPDTNGPPRADDISPINGYTGGTIVVPAPPRRAHSYRNTPTPSSRTSNATPRHTPSK